MRSPLILGSLAAAIAIASPAAAGDKFWKTFADIGAVGIPIAAGAITLYENDRNGLLQLAETGAVAAGATVAMKYSIQEQRPNGADNHSFPSLHSSVAFAGAGYLHARYGWKVGVPFELLALGVGVARVKSHDHHWWDVLAGAAIGEGSAFLLTKRLDENVRVSLGGDSTGGVVAVAARF